MKPQVKQFQGSKAKARKRAKIMRDLKYASFTEQQRIINCPDSDIEDVAKALGIKLN
jgi:hypothetical protein